MDLETRKKRTLFYDGLEEPRAIAVDPEMGLIFWTDWGKEARIERAGMDGQHRTVGTAEDFAFNDAQVFGQCSSESFEFV